MDVQTVDRMNTSDEKFKKSPGPISRFLFLWIFPIFYNGNRRDLDQCDLVPPRNIYSSKFVSDKLERTWLEEEVNARARGGKPSFFKVILKAFGWSYLPGGIMQLCCVICRTVAPLLFAELLRYWSKESNMSRSTATCYALGMLGASALAAFASGHGNLFCQQFGMKLRVATSSLLYRKIMRMDNGALGEAAAGKVVNLLSNDLLRFDLAFMYLHYMWIVPLQITAICYLSYQQTGFAALIGIAALVIIALPLQGLVSRRLGKIRFRTAVKTDERIKVMNEVINGIQVIKMYAWEIPFEKLVQKRREEEMVQVGGATMYRSILLGFLLFAEKTALFVTILALILTGNYLSASVIYPLQQFMNAMQLNITLMLPFMMSFIAELKVSLRRVQDFLWLDERSDLRATLRTMSDPKIKRSFEESTKPTVKPIFSASGFVNDGFMKSEEKPSPSLAEENDIAVDAQNVSASWVGDANTLALKNISLQIPKGKLCAIIGAVGSGKSSFLQLLLKELAPCDGAVSLLGKVSYASQEPWLFGGTVRDNILFGLHHDPNKYNKVCRTCALETDFEQLPFGDQTLVGERGAALSGGQRARINLARAVYREADIYLLDDPLSAVDANVGRQLFEGCINGYLRGRTRILVTHQLHFLTEADLIVVFKEGAIVNVGSFAELSQTSKEFATILREDDDQEGSNMVQPKSLKSRQRTTSASNDKAKLQGFEAQKMEEEKRGSGNLRWEIVSQYFVSGSSWCFVAFAFAVIGLSAMSTGVCDYWISYWSNQIAAYEKLRGRVEVSGLDVTIGKFKVSEYLTILGVLVFLCISITNLRTPPFLKLCVSSSKALHQKMFSTMIKGKMRFFDTSSSGRILNRFAKDIGTVDDVLPRALLDVSQITVSVLTVIALNAVAMQWTLLASFLLLLIFCLCVKIYLRTAQSIKRLEGVTKSPVFNMVTSSLDGIPTIRSTGAEGRFIDEFDKHQDVHTSAWMCYLGGATAFGLYLDLLCLLYLGMIIFVFLYLDFGSVITVGSVGLAVSQTNTLTLMLQHGARMFVEFVAQLTSVERVLEYTRIETEPNLFEGLVPSPASWPSQGKIQLMNVDLRYAPDQPPVLKNLNVAIESGWKVGIVGRTGAGKSSLVSALFRFAYIDGTILIDDVDTSLISKQSLRSNISIIPQEPVLFSASIRYNLDPFDVYTDEEIWRALEQVEMKSAVPTLDFKVTEGGGNFSVGQRQLMCLARAALRSNKILIMDEATANVDPQTDGLIQKTIRQKFSECTVLTIAHRLNTIMDSDRVLVMDSGQVVEFDHPHLLLTNPNGHLSSMVRETGDQNSKQLYQMAKDAYFLSHVRGNVT